MIGLRIDSFVLESVLGKGGMGTVYLARHPVLDPRAVKVLSPEMARDPMLVTRFFKEARAADAIGHPNIIKMFDVGTLPNGTPYMMMELLKGESLADRLRRVRTLAVQDAVEIACQTASALAAAHNHNIIHRDLKPGNLFLVPAPALLPLRERVKVLDFGIAKFFDESPDGSVETRPGTLLGTPKYMSPEQCRGVSRDIDHRADIYALGIIIYEMLCGLPPFNSEGSGDLLKLHMDCPPRPPREQNQQIPGALDAVILRALAKERNQRFKSMEEFESALRFAQGPATVAIPGQEEFAPTSILPPGTSQPGTPASASVGSVRAPHTTLSGSTGPVTDAKAGKPKRSWLGMAALMAVVAAIAAIAVALTLRQTTPVPTSPTVQPPATQVPASLPATPDAAVLATPPPPSAAPQPAPARPAASPAARSAAKRSKSKAGAASAPVPNSPAPPKKSEAILEL